MNSSSINKPVLRKEAIRLAADVAQGKPLCALYALCEGQKTVSTSKLILMLDKAHNRYLDSAVMLRKLHDALGD